MGRNPADLKKRKTDLFNFRCPDFELMGNIHTIAKREGQPVAEIIIEALREYDERHGPGNSQTILGSFVAGGVRSEGQIEQEIINGFQASPDWREIKFKDIISRLREHGYSSKKLRQGAERVAEALKEKGRQVWR